jgi:O-antigen ligase
MEKLYALNISEIIKVIKSEGMSFFFICVYLFFEYVRPQSIYTFIDIVPWVPIVLSLTVISILINKEFYKPPNILNKLIVFYAIIVFVSSYLSEYPVQSFSRWRTFFDWFIIYFLIIITVNNEKRFFIFFLSFLIYSLKMSQHGFFTWARRGFAFSDWGVTGAPGWFHNSGEVGIQMCVYVPLAVAFIIAVYKYLSKSWLAFLLLMPFTGIGTAIGSSSRGALVGMAFAGIRPLLLKPRLFIRGAVVLALGTIIVIYATPEEFKLRFHSAGSDRTSLHRIERWQDGINAMNKFPFFGVGFEVWPEYYSKYYIVEHHGTPLVHNFFIQCGSELGYSGLIVLILMIYGCFLNTRKIRPLCREKDDRFFYILSYGFDAALLGFIGSGFFVTVLYYPFFWIHCALVTCFYSVVMKSHRESKRGQTSQ